MTMRNSLRSNSSTALNLLDTTAHEVAAFASLIRPFQRAIYLAALAIVSNPEEALEIAQDTAVQAFKSAANIDAVRHFKTWLIGIAVDEARAFLRDRKRISIDDVFSEDELELGVCDFRNASFSRTQWLSADAIANAVWRIPRKDRLVLFLRDVLLLTNAEAACIIGITETAVRVRLARARFELCGRLMSVSVKDNESGCSGILASC